MSPSPWIALAGDLNRQVLDLTDGYGAEVAIEWPAPSPARGGRHGRGAGRTVVLIGIPHRGTWCNCPTTWRGARALTIKMWPPHEAHHPRTIDLCSAGMIDLSSYVTHRMPLGRGRHGFDLVQRYADGVIKAPSPSRQAAGVIRQQSQSKSRPLGRLFVFTAIQPASLPRPSTLSRTSSRSRCTSADRR